VAIITHKPTHKGEEKLAERGVNVEEICPLYILGSEKSIFDTAAARGFVTYVGSEL
jgi:hypothetical protein